MAIQRARTPEEYAEMVRQAKFEIGDLKDCLLYEMEDLTTFPAFLEPLEEGIDAIYQAMRQGEYAFGREDLQFMELANLNAEHIPFHVLLQQINETHRRGLDVDEEI